MELSICIPTYNRPDLFRGALTSVVQSPSLPARNVEIVVSDNSTDDRSAAITARLTENWQGSVVYQHNSPGIPRVDNQNRCVSLATGRWVQILHDDDYLLRDGLSGMLAGLGRAGESDRVLLFGVRVVDRRGKLIRSQLFRRDRTLPPELALKRLLSNSSLVRMPAIVVRRDIYAEIGRFESGLDGKEDIAMWIRLFGAYGVRLLPLTTCAYRVHPGADSYAVCTPEAITTLTRIFSDTVPQGLLSDRVMRQCRAHFFHQFVLAGAFRRLRVGDRVGARKVMELFRMPEVRTLGPSPRWAPVRLAVATACVGANDASS